MSDLGSLSQCMLESDAEGLSASRVLRRKALTLSVVLEAAIVSLLIIGPLLYPGVLPNVLSRTPVPPYHRGLTEVFVENVPRGPSTPSNTPHPTLNFLAQQPAHIPTQIYEGPLPDVGNAIGPASDEPGVPFGDPNGPVAAVNGRQLPPEIKPPAEKPTKPLNVSQGVMEGALISQIKPAYPGPARSIHLSGDVVLHAIIGKDGTVRDLQVLSGNPLLVQSALTAVQQWRYRPTMLSGEPVEVATTITVRFILGSE
ncbi:MAG: TonB family protein [Candidatus Acidiferrales bacterium]|jgi:protein TonB